MWVLFPGWVLSSALTDSSLAHGMNQRQLKCWLQGLLDRGPHVDERDLSVSEADWGAHLL